jgi:hypothetical protein
MISQIILTVILLFLEFYFATAEGGPRVVRIFVCTVILAGIGLVWRPELSNQVAHAVGISRGADLVMYLWVLISFLLIGRSRLRILRLERDLSDVVRHLALIGEGRPKGGFDRRDRRQ